MKVSKDIGNNQKLLNTPGLKHRPQTVTIGGPTPHHIKQHHKKDPRYDYF